MIINFERIDELLSNNIFISENEKVQLFVERILNLCHLSEIVFYKGIFIFITIREFILCVLAVRSLMVICNHNDCTNNVSFVKA